MSLLSRLRDTEAQRSHDAVSAQTASVSGNKENLDPRSQMMKDIQAMLDGFPTCPSDGRGSPLGDGRNGLTHRLKRR